MSFLLRTIFQFMLIYGVIKIQYKNQILFCFIMSFISLISLPLCVKFIGGETGFNICCFFILFQGDF